MGGYIHQYNAYCGVELMMPAVTGAMATATAEKHQYKNF